MIFWASLFLGITYWVMDAVVDSSFFTNDNFLASLLTSEVQELWMRGLVLFVAITFGSVAQYYWNRARLLRDELQRVNLTLEDELAKRTNEILQFNIKLQEREERIKAILNTVVDAIITIDHQGIIQTFNPAAENIFGYLEEEATGKNVSLLMPEPYASQHDSYIKNYLNTGEQKIIGKGREVVGQRKDGSIFPLDLAVSEMHLKDKLMFTGVIRDISLKKAAEEILNRFKTTLDLSGEGIFMFDPDTLRFFYVNKGAMDQVGYSEQELLSMTPLDIKTNFTEQQFREITQFLVDGPEHIIRFETIHRHKNGSQIPVGVILQYVAPEAETPRFIAITTDITELKQSEHALVQSENKFKKIVTNMQDGYCMIDLDGYIVQANPAVINMMGYENEQDLVGRHMERDIYADPQERQQVRSEILKNGYITGREVRFRKKDGTEITGEVNANVVYGKNGQMTGIEGTFRDVTARKQVEDALKIAKDEAEQSSQAKSQFLSSMSHELRTPLNAVIGYSEMLVEEMTDLGQKQFIPDLERIMAAGNHLLSLINDILDLSKIEAGKLELDLSMVDVDELVKEVANTVHPLIKKNGNRLKLYIEKGLGEMQTDVVRLRQILFNLLSNAAKFTKEGMVAINVTQEAVNDQQQMVFEIRDTGAGMTPEQQTRIFEAFEQADSSIARKYGGTGLGLSISLMLCEMLGGEIELESELGKGTVFTLRLPVITKADIIEIQASENSVSKITN